MPDPQPTHLFRDRYRIASARLRGWDYASPGLHFVTICVKNRVLCLAEIVNGEARLSRIGEIVAEEWQKTEQVRANVVMDVWVIMPNHLHGIVAITHTVETTGVETPRRGVSTDRRTAAASAAWKPNSLGSIMGQIKSVCTKRIWNAGHRDFAWQERFYDHIVRNERELERIRDYIANNPARWELDRDNPESVWM